MEGNGGEGIEESKEDQRAAAPAAGNEMTASTAASGRVTTASTAPGNEAMSIDDEAIAGIMIESDAAKASAVFNLQSAAAALNIVTDAQVFVAKQNWDELETSLAEFFTKVQQDKFYPHPGLFCSLYQAHITNLIGKHQFKEARAVFYGKVKPLLDKGKDDMYKPFDLEARVEMLRNCVDHCLPLPADDVEDMNVVISDYLMLYFPTSLQREANRKNSISDFLMTFDDEKGKIHRCLACQWVMPASATSRSIVSHIKHSKPANHCPRVTKWMLEYLASVEGEEEIDIQDHATGSLETQSRKRKAPLSSLPPDGQSVVIPVGLALQIWNDLSRSNMLAISALLDDRSESAVEAKEILFRQEKFIAELKTLFMHSTRKHLALGSPLAFLKVKAILNLSDDLFSLLKNLPDVSKLLLQLDEKVTELRRCFIVAAAECQTRTASADVISSFGTNNQGAAGPLVVRLQAHIVPRVSPANCSLQVGPRIKICTLHVELSSMSPDSKILVLVSLSTSSITSSPASMSDTRVGRLPARQTGKIVGTLSNAGILSLTHKFVTTYKRCLYVNLQLLTVTDS
ncbi:unnamed protein product [Urochloa humidicola]